MTDTEAKALALVNADYMMWTADNITTLVAGFKAMRAREAATEARHAAELRELKERFSEAAKDADEKLELEGYSVGCDARKGLRSFIHPAPDPLVEAIRSALPKALVAHDTYDAIVLDVAAAVRKIGEPTDDR